LRDERPVLVGGSLEVEEGVAKIMVDTVSPLEDLLKKTKSMVLHLDKLDPEHYPRLHMLMKDNPGATAVNFEITMAEVNRKVLLDTPDVSGIAVTNEFFEGIHAEFGRTDFIELRS
jgi:DNA polymerase-3 subunit alpha